MNLNLEKAREDYEAILKARKKGRENLRLLSLGTQERLNKAGDKPLIDQYIDMLCVLRKS